jgi:hypothetical protein
MAAPIVASRPSPQLGPAFLSPSARPDDARPSSLAHVPVAVRISVAPRLFLCPAIHGTRLELLPARRAPASLLSASRRAACSGVRLSFSPSPALPQVAACSNRTPLVQALRARSSAPCAQPVSLFAAKSCASSRRSPSLAPSPCVMASSPGFCLPRPGSHVSMAAPKLLPALLAPCSSVRRARKVSLLVGARPTPSCRVSLSRRIRSSPLASGRRWYSFPRRRTAPYADFSSPTWLGA